MPPEPASCAGCGAPLRRREGAWCHRCRQDRASASPPPQPPAGPCGGRTSLMISRLGRLLAEAGPASPQSILERARRPGKSAGTLARALEEFFTEAGLAFPVDHAARRAAARCQARVEEAPATLRPALARSAAGLPASRHRGFRGQTLALAEQRRLFRRWTPDPGVHPHEALAGLLALLHATPSRELRHLTVADVDASAHTVLLEHRPHPVPLDPATWQALQRCLDHRERLGTRNPHVIVTSHTRTRSTPASDQSLVRVLAPAGTGSRTLRATRLVDLVASLDPKLVCEALGMDPAGILPYAADQVQDTRLANL